jgi:hypothetical protein
MVPPSQPIVNQFYSLIEQLKITLLKSEFEEGLNLFQGNNTNTNTKYLSERWKNE